MLDQILAVILLLVIVSTVKRLTMKTKARHTSWGSFILVVNGFLFFRIPQAFGWQFFDEYADWERLVVYSVALGLNIYDWAIFEKVSKEEKENFIEREKYDLLVAQLAAIEALKREDANKR